MPINPALIRRSIFCSKLFCWLFGPEIASMKAQAIVEFKGETLRGILERRQATEMAAVATEAAICGVKAEIDDGRPDDLPAGKRMHKTYGDVIKGCA